MFPGLSPFYTVGACVLCTEYKTQAYSHTWLSLTHGAHDSTSFEAIAWAALKHSWANNSQVETLHTRKQVHNNYITGRNPKVNNMTVTTTVSGVLSHKLPSWMINLSVDNLNVLQLTPWSTVLLEKPTGLQLVKKFPAFYGNWRFITTFASAHHLSLSSASLIQAIPSHPTSWRSILILSSNLCLGLPSVLFPPGFPTKTPPISFFLILSPAQYWVRSIAPHYVVFSIPLLSHPEGTTTLYQKCPSAVLQVLQTALAIVKKWNHKRQLSWQREWK